MMDILHASIKELHRMMDAGNLTSRELVEFYLDRIARLDAGKINSVAETAEDALQTADQLDSERICGRIRGVLHGIPILVKDNIDTGDSLHTTGGTLALKEHRALRDAEVIKRLRDSGAVILGKTNLSELANFVSTKLPDGFSAGGGQVKNPLGDYEIGGSSSGSAAAVGGGFAAAAIGTETSGSIVMPSSVCGVVGLKPTVKRISSEGIIPLAPTQDTAGPIGRCVEDVKLLYEVMAGLADGDDSPNRVPGKSDEISTDAGEKEMHLNGLRIGVLSEQYKAVLDREGREIFNKTAEILRGSGAKLIPVSSQYFSESSDLSDNITIMLYEFKAGINEYLKHTEETCPVHSLKELIEYNEKHRETAVPYGQDILLEAEKTSGSLTEQEYLNAVRDSLRITREENIDAAMDEYRLDALIAPSFLACDYPARAGYPSLVVPVGFSAENGPVSLMIFGRAFSEDVLLKIGGWLEHSLHGLH